MEIKLGHCRHCRRRPSLFGLWLVARRKRLVRLAMLTWYCAEGSGHSEERPCQNYHFMQKLRKAENPELRKKLVRRRVFVDDTTGRCTDRVERHWLRCGKALVQV